MNEQKLANEPSAWLITIENQNGNRETIALTGRYKDILDACDFGEPIPLYTAIAQREPAATKQARHPNDDVQLYSECEAALARRGDNRGQGLDPFWKMAYRTGWHECVTRYEPVAEGEVTRYCLADIGILYEYRTGEWVRYSDWQRTEAARVAAEQELKKANKMACELFDHLKDAQAQLIASRLPCSGSMSGQLRKFCICLGTESNHE